MSTATTSRTTTTLGTFGPLGTTGAGATSVPATSPARRSRRSPSRSAASGPAPSRSAAAASCATGRSSTAPPRGDDLPLCFFALWARPEGGGRRRADARAPAPAALRRRPRPVALGASPALPRLDEATFVGTYPTATIGFHDSTPARSRSELEAFTPFVPLDDRVSGLPVAVFLWRLRNPSAGRSTSTLAYTQLNPVGYDGVSDPAARPAPRDVRREREPVGGRARDPRPPDEPARLRRPATPARGRWRSRRRGATSRSPSTGSGAAGSTTSRTSGTTSAPTAACRTARRARPARPGRPTRARSAFAHASAPGETVELPVVLAWHFPNLVNYWGPFETLPGQSVVGGRMTNWFATQWPDAWAAARGDARARCRADRADADLPRRALRLDAAADEVLDAVTSQMTIIRTTTCLRTADGSFHGFEGCNDNVGCCPMNCTHVWNYEQALAYLFPALERTMRDDRLRDQHARRWRYGLPHRAAAGAGRAVGLQARRRRADGQRHEGVSRVAAVRRYQMAAQALARGQARAGIRLARPNGMWDPDPSDGVMEGEQHNTYDIEFYGPNTMCGSLYLGALRAAEELARALGEDATADEYRTRLRAWPRTAGQRAVERRILQRSTPVDRIVEVDHGTQPVARIRRRCRGENELRYQYGRGCLTDQLLGQWFARGGRAGQPAATGARARGAGCDLSLQLRTRPGDARQHPAHLRAERRGRAAAVHLAAAASGRASRSPTPTRSGPASNTRSPRT